MSDAWPTFESGLVLGDGANGKAKAEHAATRHRWMERSLPALKSVILSGACWDCEVSSEGEDGSMARSSTPLVWPCNACSLCPVVIDHTDIMASAPPATRISSSLSFPVSVRHDEAGAEAGLAAQEIPASLEQVTHFTRSECPPVKRPLGEREAMSQLQMLLSQHPAKSVVFE